MRDKDNIIIHELIGLKVKVINSSCRNHIGLSGAIVDESKNTFTIQENDRTRVVPKKSCKFRFMLNDQKSVVVDGKILMYAPEDRIKKLINKMNKWLYGRM